MCVCVRVCVRGEEGLKYLESELLNLPSSVNTQQGEEKLEMADTLRL